METPPPPLLGFKRFNFDLQNISKRFSSLFHEVLVLLKLQMKEAPASAAHKRPRPSYLSVTSFLLQTRLPLFKHQFKKQSI